MAEHGFTAEQVRPRCRGDGQQLPRLGQLGVNVHQLHPKQALELADPVVHELAAPTGSFPVAAQV